MRKELHSGNKTRQQKEVKQTKDMMKSTKRERNKTPKLKKFKPGLNKVNKNEKKPKGKKSKTIEKADMVYIVESLLQKEGSMYLVKWENYTHWWNSWEPKEGLPPSIINVSEK